MTKRLLLTAVAAVIAHVSFAQFSEFQNNAGSTFTLSSDNNTLQIGGRISGFYEYRVMKPGETNLSHDGLEFKDCDLDVLGKTSSKFVYEMHVSLIDLATAAATQNTDNPANPGIKAAYLEYRGFPVHIKLGYDKVPYSQGSLNEVYGSPYWSHANLYGGDLFSRRDFGLTLNYRFLKNMVNLYGGAYSGMGENFFEYGNDASGTFEYIGRAEFSYPGKMQYKSIDEENSPIPTFRLAINGRFANKTQPDGKTIGADAAGVYGLRVINGKRSVYGGDFIVKYRGISALFETDMIDLHPADANDALYEGTVASVNHGVVHAGGFVTGLNYNWENLRSVFSVQYETINVNDLLPGQQDWVYFGYAYKISGFNSVFKAEYYIPTKEDVASNPLKYTGQLRVGYQVVF